jgi:hypothetical protein
MLIPTTKLLKKCIYDVDKIVNRRKIRGEQYFKKNNKWIYTISQTIQGDTFNE